mmetsp:Transcript_48853/g.35951  ORF Transcript_48853/g.35951 Transcript_48853/m.35951 type:complete len:113 (+) Transcript_48853:148-486(+)
MNQVSLKQLNIESFDDPKYFQKDLNRVVIEGSEDYRLVLFFIKKGVKMNLHDHPNMSVYFRLLFGSLDYRGFDKLDSKFKYNAFAPDEYEEFLQTQRVIECKETAKGNVSGE